MQAIYQIELGIRLQARDQIALTNVVNELQEENQFLGEANDLVYDRVYKLNFFCDFELHYYPFDKQKCPVMVSNI